MVAAVQLGDGQVLLPSRAVRTLHLGAFSRASALGR